jgi:hypothetical protein
MLFIIMVCLIVGLASYIHRRIARSGHEFPKLLLGPAMPYPSTPCRQATPETAVSEVARPQPV